jgi:hypothetical protein
MRVCLLSLLLFVCVHGHSQDRPKVSLFDSLAYLQKIAITLTYPFDSLYKTNNNDVEAVISISSASGQFISSAPLNLNLRGKFRRMKCTMPPLMLNFKKSTLRELGLSNADEMKLVTHCIDGTEGENNLKEEFLLYQIYQNITPVSYRTIWADVTYIDANDPVKIVHTFGFLIEPDKVISSRLGMDERKLYNLQQDSICYDSYSMAAAFNFLIGNRDWSVTASRNAKLFYEPDLGKYVVIPYDFDYSNIVGASYRRETLPKTMKHPFDRIYSGEYYADKSGVMLKTFAAFEQPVLETIFSSSNSIDPARRTQISNYFKSWFDMIRRHKPEQLTYGVICAYKGEL